MRTELDELIEEQRVEAQAGVRIKAQVGAMLTVAERVLVGAGAVGCMALIAYYTYRGSDGAAADVQRFKDKYFGSFSSSPYVSGDAALSLATETDISSMSPDEIKKISDNFAQGQSFTDVGVGPDLFVNEFGFSAQQSFGSTRTSDGEEVEDWDDFEEGFTREQTRKGNEESAPVSDMTAINKAVKTISKRLSQLPPKDRCAWLNDQLKQIEGNRNSLSPADQAQGFRIGPTTGVPFEPWIHALRLLIRMNCPQGPERTSDPAPF